MTVVTYLLERLKEKHEAKRKNYKVADMTLQGKLTLNPIKSSFTNPNEHQGVILQVSA